MATKTTSITSRSWATGPSLKCSGSVTVTRASTTTKEVSMEASLTFTLGAGTHSSYLGSGYSIVVKADTGAANDTAGWTERTVKSSSITWYGDDPKTVSPWKRSFNLTGSSFTFKFYVVGSGAASDSSEYSYKSQSSPVAITVNVPPYDSSGGSSGGGATANTMVSFNISPTTAYPGEKVTFSGTGKAGTGNFIGGYNISGSALSNAPGLISTSNTSFSTSIYAPSTIGEHTYSCICIGTPNSTSKTVKLNVIERPPDPPSIPTNPYAGSIEGDGGSHYTTISCYCDSDYCYYAINNRTKIAMQQGSYSSYFGGYRYSAGVTLSQNDTVYFYGYNGNEYSSSVTARPSVYYSVYDASVTLNPIIIKDNTLEPDLVNIIQSGTASARTSGGGLSYTWEYSQASTSSGVGSTWNNLGVSGSSFSNLDMTQRVSPGYYYQIRVKATNSYDEYDYSDNSAIYQLPKAPGAATITQVIAKADPSNGYNDIIQGGKKFYGSGLFLKWTNPDVTASQLPISNIEIIYQSKLQTETIYNEIQYTQIAYSKVQGETAYPLPPSINPKAQNGGGADLEVSSLRETKVGIRITDTLGQSSDTWYEAETFFKAESPGFGGNITINKNSFRPFTCDDTYISITSSVAQSAAQDELLYFIDCYIGDRKETIHLLNAKPISSAIFTDDSKPADSVISSGDIDIIKQNSTTIEYRIKNSFFKNLLLNNNNLTSPKGNSGVYNDDFTNVIYKVYVKDNFDSRSTVYNSEVTSINYIEAPFFANENSLALGVNRYLNSVNPTYDNSIVLVNRNSSNNDRMVNKNESIIFKFMPAQDYNAADWNSTKRGDVSKYNIYVSRNDSPIDEGNYILLKTYEASELKNFREAGADTAYYYLEYQLNNYNESKFVFFKIEAVDSKGQKSNQLTSDTYVVPCRVSEMDFYINNVTMTETTDNGLDVTFKTKVGDMGASYFSQREYGYDKPNVDNAFPNFERNFTVNGNNFSAKGYLVFEGSLTGDFTDKGQVILEKEDTTGNITTKVYNNYFSEEIDLTAYLGVDKKYPDVFLESFPVPNFPAEWKTGITTEKFIKKIFFKATYKIAYTFKNLSGATFEEKYHIIESISAPYSYYEDSPTLSYRNHQVGINTKDFSGKGDAGKKEVLIVQDNGSYNLVVFKGAEKRLELDLTKRTFTAIGNNNKTIVLNFDDGTMNNMTIDSGTW